MYRPTNGDQHLLIYGGYWKVHLPFDTSKHFSSIDSGFDRKVETRELEGVVKFKKFWEFVIIPPTVVNPKPKNTYSKIYLTRCNVTQFIITYI
jgi:hypothetical protein